MRGDALGCGSRTLTPAQRDSVLARLAQAFHAGKGAHLTIWGAVDVERDTISD